MIKILNSADGQYYFIVTAKNGKVLVTSETYTRKANCQAGAVALIDLMPKVKTIIDQTKK